MASDIRALANSDIPQAVRVLHEGFPHRSAAYWHSGLDRLAARDPIAGTVGLGHGLWVDGAMRGVILSIPSIHETPFGPRIFVNLSSWSVDPAHRGRAALQLYVVASTGDSEVTYTNLSATARTLKAVLARGFREWTAGQLLCLGIRASPGRKRFLPPRLGLAAGLSAATSRVLIDHEALGCLAVCIETPLRSFPLVFLKRKVNSLPLAQLLYCERLEELVDNGLAVSAWLLSRGYPAMIIDSNGPIAGLPGRYFAGKARKFVKGPEPAFAADHTYSEMMYFGL